MVSRLIRGVGALVVLVVFLVGAPMALLAWVGSPWPPGGWPEVQLVTSRTILGFLAVVGWLAWAQMAACVFVELVAAVRGTVPNRIKFASGGQQQFARILVTSVVALGIGAGTVGPCLAATTAAPRPETSVAQASSQLVAASAQGGQVSQVGQVGQGRQVATVSGPVITVERDTTMWKLAETHLEDGSRWRVLFDLNRGAALGDGSTLAQATQTIPAGTTFRLPGSATAVGTPSDKAHDGTYTVKPNDTLWEIAEENLADPTRYMDLFKASTHTVQPGGEHLVDPDHIEVGWTITIPGGAGGETKGDHAPGGPRRDQQPPQQDEDTDQGNQGEQGNQPDQGDQGAAAAPEGPEGGRAPESEPTVPSPEALQAEAPQAGPDALDDGASDQEVTDDGVLDAAWVLPGLTGGGVLLAGSLFLGLQRRRRAQFRSRRPGRVIAGPPPELAPAEMTVNAAGAPAAATVAFADEALRRLAEHTRTRRGAMPPLAAVQLHKDTLTLHLSGPAELPAPWEGSPDRLHWSCSTSTDVDDLGPVDGWAEAPYPMLVTVGRGDEGDLWLLNCEELGTVEVVGDPSRARDFARHLAAQLAVNPWSRQVSVDCIGIAEETEALGDRIRYHGPGHAGAGAAAEVLADAVAMVDRTTSHDTDVSTGRTGGLDDDVWPARMLLIAADVAEIQHDTEDPLKQLRELLSAHVGRTGTAIVVTGNQVHETVGGDPAAAAAGTVIRVTQAGRVVLERQGLDLAGVGLTSDEAHGCAQLYAHSENLQDVEVPVDESATEGWEAYVDLGGALRSEYTLSRSTTAADVGEPLTSLLERDDEEYVAVAAATTEDLEAVAPKVLDSVLAEVKQADPTLDEDLADWFDPDCPRPKLTLLGPVAVRTHGRPLAKYKAICTEIVAYLALRPRNGATRDELAEAMGWADPARVRKYVDLVRHWLGEDPQTHEPYLPHASKSAAAKTRGVNVYQVTGGLLTDVDLFKRLRARGTLADLIQALELVTGRPFDQLREGGRSWLREGTAHDQVMTSGIADVAFTVVTHCLREGDLSRARAAADIASLAVPDEQVVQLCQVALTEAEGEGTEAMRVLLEDVCNRAEDGEAPLDLPERTREIIRNHQWLAS